MTDHDIHHRIEARARAYAHSYPNDGAQVSYRRGYLHGSKDTELAIEQLKHLGSHKVLVVKPATEVPPPSTHSPYKEMGYSDPYFGIGQSPSRERFLVIAQYYFPRGEWRSIQVGMKQLLEYYVESE